jgi:hypothetical protein
MNGLSGSAEIDHVWYIEKISNYWMEYGELHHEPHGYNTDTPQAIFSTYQSRQDWHISS